MSNSWLLTIFFSMLILYLFFLFRLYYLTVNEVDRNAARFIHVRTATN